MALKYDNIQAKLGKAVDLPSLEQLKLPNKQITEVSDLSKLKLLKEIDLSNNRIQFQRQLEGLFKAEALEVVTLTGNPVVNSRMFRIFMVINLPNLKVLDGVYGRAVTDEDRSQAQAIANGEAPAPARATSPPPTTEAAGVTKSPSGSALNAAPARAEPTTLAKSPSATAVAAPAQEPHPEPPKMEVAPQPVPTRAASPPPVVSAPAPTPAPPKPEPKPEPAVVKSPSSNSVAQAVEPPKVAEQARPVSPPPAEASKPAVLPDQFFKGLASAPVKSTQLKPEVVSVESVLPPAAKKTAVSTATAPSTKPNTERETQVFKDTRSGLSISTALSDGTAKLVPKAPPKKKPVRQIQKKSEESIFGTKEAVDEWDPEDGAAETFSVDDDLDLAQFQLPPTTTKKVIPTTTITAAPAAPTPSAKPVVIDDDDDLFSLVKPQAKKAGSNFDLGTSFNVDEYVASTTTATSGGLFD